MEKELATVEVCTLNTVSKADAEGRSPVVLRIYCVATRKVKDYRSGTYIFVSNEELALAKAKLGPQIKRAEDIINRMRLNNQVFSFEAFDRQFKSRGGTISVKQYLEDAAKQQSKPANRKAIEDLVSVMDRLIKKPDLQFGEITRTFLQRFSMLMNNSKSMGENTVAFHHRTLRKHFNEAVEAGLAPRLPESPWIGINTQSVPSKEVKRFLLDEEFAVFKAHQYKPRRSIANNAVDSRNLWLVSYYMFGLNMKDILDIKWSDIQGDTIIRGRTKTGEPLTVRVGKNLREILDQYTKNEEYIFGHLRVKGTADNLERNHDKILGWVGDHIKALCKQAGIKNSGQVTFYSARHTFAVHYMKKEPGASTFKLMLYLGQASEQSTRNYLQSLIGNEEVKAVSFLDE
jgi:integrase